MRHLELLFWRELDSWEKEDRMLLRSLQLPFLALSDKMCSTNLVEHIDDLCHTPVIHCIWVETFYLPSKIFESRCISRGRDWQRRIGIRLSLSDGRHGSFLDDGWE